MLRFAVSTMAALLLLCSASGRAQNQNNSGATPPSPQPGASSQNPNQNPDSRKPRPDYQPAPFTLHAEARVVLSDVMVTDSKGNPIHGLPRTDFHVYDNGQLQNVDSFQEHTVQQSEKYTPASESGSAGTFSNAYLKTLPPVLNVVVIDIANLGVVYQMYLYSQLTKFFQQAPLDQPIAVYLRAGSGCFLVQDFTADRNLLLTALRRAIPRIPPTGREWLNDLDTMHRLALLLGPVQGRKNVLWFSGGSTLFMREDPQIIEDYANWRVLYDELEQERIALYPIDARGLTVEGGGRMIRQQMLMNDMAQATGGHAIYNSNGLKEAAAHLMDVDRSYYTLTYSPQNFKRDNKYHKIKIELADGSHYKLSYRQGYFADGSVGGSADLIAAPRPRTRVLSDGQKITLPGFTTEPITFQARLLEASLPELTQSKPTATLQAAEPRKKSKPYVVRYTVPAADLTIVPDGDKQKIAMGVASIELSDVGTLADKRMEEIRFNIPNDKLAQVQGKSIVIDQPVNLRRDDKYLYLAVWDPTSGRAGTVQVPIEIPK
ncbi:VWA domain-containing protein [Silvibacterium acidisoli]|uniref:VWA domain-containing protein n=1 Tax=Acidobacteriaceae bacterium ZG23-2 TaxID=2883246 RepID=UPI00406C7223